MNSMNSRSAWVSNINPAIASSSNEVILYGAGCNAARFIIQCRHNDEDINILCVLDADTNRHGSLLMGVPIVSPESIVGKYDTKTCVIVTPVKYCIAITAKMNSLGFFRLLYYHGWNSQIIEALHRTNARIADNRNMLDSLLAENSEKIDFVRKSLQHDEKSLAVFNAKLNSKYFADHILLEALHEDDQYFPKDIIKLSKCEVFVDCGALDGGTTLDFISRACQYEYIYVFEPDVMQYELTKLCLATEKIKDYELYNYGVYDREGEIKFKMQKLGRSKINTEGDITVPVISIDALLYGKPNRPTFIKMDIERAELEALHGARKIIERDKPKLAISVYHGDVHLWEIPYWIKANFSGYKIYMRQHLNINETVCYAIWGDAM